jgi:hypothetical protein
MPKTKKICADHLKIPMTFRINIEYHKRTIRLSVEQLSIDDRMERYKVIGRNGAIVIESNRPLFRARGLRQRPPKWRQIEGKPISDHALQLIAKAIQDHIEPGNS